MEVSKAPWLANRGEEAQKEATKLVLIKINCDLVYRDLNELVQRKDWCLLEVNEIIVMPELTQQTSLSLLHLLSLFLHLMCKTDCWRCKQPIIIRMRVR
mmetsp:Transcript_26315/g.47738  ORF Transcript_26315/g.47738 Transcript_26315/m.47738 type:complete len:99 (-) Transcript_26315:77-373(-)